MLGVYRESRAPSVSALETRLERVTKWWRVGRSGHFHPRSVGAQSVGPLHTDVGRDYIDGLAVSTQKGLLGFYGFGFLYCRRAFAERMQPAYLARFDVDVGEAHEASLGGDNFSLARGARRFDLGNYNFLGLCAADASLELGTPMIEAHNLRLASRLCAGLNALGLPVAGGPPGPHLSHTVSVGAFGDGQRDSTNDTGLEALYRHLIANDVKLTIRRGMLRMAVHLYNNDADVDRALELSADFLARSG
jgi:selenocysteine lyase/cysteine desulfurase